MSSNGLIAIYNATDKELLEVESNTQVENYWRQLEGNEQVYVLEDYEWVDEEQLAKDEHENFVKAGWSVLQ